ncbi:hypothetical protein LUZ60_012116 [Juncus effusus]|nr:hypothetical protein LUZ60_012116 [Juncus effusus]
MSSFWSSIFLIIISFQVLSLHVGLSNGDLAQELPMNMTYHNGPLLTGKITVNFIWYGSFTTSQKSTLTDFIASLSPGSSNTEPSVATWWNTLRKYYENTGISFPTLTLGDQISDIYWNGGSLNMSDILPLASMGPQQNAINVVVTSADVGVEGFCVSRCGLHGSGSGSNTNRFTYVWLGNSSTQCPGQCAWPFAHIDDVPSITALVPPNGEAGTDGMVVSFASLLVGTMTNPFGDGFYQGEPETPLEAATACPGIFGKRSFPGFAGILLVDSATKASYNACGVNGRKYLVPALFDLSSAGCVTTV